MVSWTEKHRPTSLEGVSGNDEVIKALQSYKTIESLPNMILHGPPGSGKTTSILAIANSFYKGSNLATMTLELNAGDARGIDTIRDQIHHFTQCSSVTEQATKAVKLIILDEADGLTGCAQRALRHLIETSGDRARFCLCCNYISKLSTGLRSRCTSFSFSGVGKAQLARTLKTVAQKERLEISKEGLCAIIDICDGDAREAINLLQSLNLGHTTTSTTTTDDHAVYKACGLPPPFEIDVLFRALLDQSFSDGYDTLHSFVSHEQFALAQIMSPFVERIISCNDGVITPERAGGILSILASVERSLSEGGSQCLAIGAVVGAFKKR
jgi:replication factor C subunit 3/5